MEFVLIALITTLLICAIGLPLHVIIRKLPLRNTVTDPKFWVSTLSVSTLVAVLVSLSEA